MSSKLLYRSTLKLKDACGKVKLNLCSQITQPKSIMIDPTKMLTVARKVKEIREVNYICKPLEVLSLPVQARCCTLNSNLEPYYSSIH